MASALYRLGKFAFRRRGYVVTFWAAAVVAVAIGAATLSGPTSNTFSIPGTESQQALDLLSQRTGANADRATAEVVFIAGDGSTVTSPSTRQAIETAVKDLGTLPNVGSVSDPFQTQRISQDGSTALATVTYAIPASEITPADQSALMTAGRSVASSSLSVEFTGNAVQPREQQNPAEALGILVAAAALLITFGSILAAGLPLLTAAIGVGLGFLGITIATGFFQLSATTSTLAVMLGLAVGIDYALLIVSRYRHELLHGQTTEEAAGRAVGTAGSAVVFAGLTVIIALSALSVVGIPFLTQMGLAAAGTVAMAVLIALSLLPAILGFTGVKVLGRKGLAAKDSEADDAVAAIPFGERWARGILRHRVAALVVAIAGLGVIAIPSVSLHLGMPSGENSAPDSTQYKAYMAIADTFGPGVNGPLIVVADLTGVSQPQQAANRIGQDLAGTSGIAFASPAQLIPPGSTAIFQVIPTTGPSDTATETLVHTIRAESAAWKASTGASVYVTGATAVAIDVSQTLSNALLPYLAIVVGLAFVLLMLVFRSILVPLKAALGFLLSVAVAFGSVVAVFQEGWWPASLLGVDATGPIMSFLPVLLIGILFGLAMDYEVFLVTRMHEEHGHGATAQESIVLGFRHGARVVTAAAVIMVSVFAGFVTSHDSVIKSIGFALAFGVFIDAFVVRMTIVPAVMSLLGERAWWLPKWLDRILPDLDVEGQRLTAQLAAAPADELKAAKV